MGKKMITIKIYFVYTSNEIENELDRKNGIEEKIKFLEEKSDYIINFEECRQGEIGNVIYNDVSDIKRQLRDGYIYDKNIAKGYRVVFKSKDGVYIPRDGCSYFDLFGGSCVVGPTTKCDNFKKDAIFKMDIRRMICGYVTRFSFEMSIIHNNKKYTEIKYDKDTSEKWKRVCFNATYTETENNNGAQNNEYDVEMGIPTTDIATDSTIDFYILKKSIKAKSSDKSEIDLCLGEKYQIRVNEYIDLLYGTVQSDTKVQKGWFYYFQNELKPYYAVEKDENQNTITYIYSDIRYSFNTKKEYHTCLKIKNTMDKGEYEVEECNFPRSPVILEPKKFCEENEKASVKELLENLYEFINSKYTGIDKEDYEGFQNTFNKLIDLFIFPNKSKWNGHDCKRVVDRDKIYEFSDNGYTFKIDGILYYYNYQLEFDCIQSLLSSSRLSVLSQIHQINYYDENKNPIFIIKPIDEDLECTLFSEIGEDLTFSYNEICSKFDIGEIKNNINTKINIGYNSSPEGIENYIKGNTTGIIKLKNVIENLGEADKEKFRKYCQTSNYANKIDEIAKALYPADDEKDILVPDRDVAAEIYEIIESFKQESDKQKTSDQQIPNFVIMGGPGTGKTTLAKNLAEYLGMGFEVRSASDLKGMYVGHTIMNVCDLLKKADEEKAIILIDEAYGLCNDQFGKEAMELLLPLMSGNRNEIPQYELNNNGSYVKDPEDYTFKNGVPAIWFSGYEQETREMLSQNPGLYRRMDEITLKSPKTSDLYNYLLELAKQDDLTDSFASITENKTKESSEESEGKITKSLKDPKNEKVIKNFFNQATSLEFEKYFGGYAGVKEFHRSYKFHFTQNSSRPSIEKIIEKKMAKMKKQRKSILAKNTKNTTDIPFRIERDIQYTFENIVGYKNVTDSLKKTVKILFDKDGYVSDGITIPRGVLLYGEPGTGKTSMARAFAGELQKELNSCYNNYKDIAFIAVTATELDRPEKISTLFSTADDYSICIIFIDEIDAIGTKRSMNRDTAPILAQLLKEMDGFEKRDNVFVIAATNMLEKLDPALIRPGRFDQKIRIGYPNSDDRKAIIEYYLKNLKDINQSDKDKDEIASMTRGMSPSGIRNVINLAAIEHKLGNNDEFISIIESKINQQLFGEITNRKDSKEKFQSEINCGYSAIAIHEVGHALIITLLYEKQENPFETVTIISRNDMSGFTKHNKMPLSTKQQLLNRICIALGGRAAEELFYGDDISLGASQDIANATELARRMVAQYGMSAIGPIALRHNARSSWESTSEYTCSDVYHNKADDETQRILIEQLERARHLLTEHKETVRALAAKLFKTETMSGKEFKQEFSDLCSK